MESPWAILPRVERVPRVALIGVSGYARIYLNLLRELVTLGAVYLAAVVIINPEEETAVVSELEQAGSRIYSDFESLFSEERGRLDLCFIPTGIPWHAPMTMAALESGANVLVEKPLAASMNEVEAIQRTERSSGRWVAVGFQDIYQPSIRWLKEKLLSGEAGGLLSLRFMGIWPRSRLYFSRNDWAGRLAAEGRMILDSPLNNAFAHFVNLSLFLAGPSLTESAGVVDLDAELYRAHEIESCDTAVVRAVTDTGIRMFFGGTHACETRHEPEIVIEAEKGAAYWLHEQTCTVVSPSGITVEKPLPGALDSRRQMFAAVLRRLSDPETLVCGTSVAERHTEFIAAMHASAGIQTVDQGLIDWTILPDDEAPLPCVHGLREKLRLAFERGCLLRDVGFHGQGGS